MKARTKERKQKRQNNNTQDRKNKSTQVQADDREKTEEAILERKSKARKSKTQK